MEKHIKVIDALANFLDNKFEFAGIKIGVDPLIGLIPWIGDVIAMGLSMYILWVAQKMKLPKELFNKMIRNVVLDFVIGLFPVVGDIGDFFFRANSRNLHIIRQYLASKDRIEEGVVVS